MRISEIDRAKVKHYIRIDDEDMEDDALVDAVLEAAKSYAETYTGLPIQKTEGQEDYLDKYQDVTIAILVLCQDMYDNRSMYVDKGNVNQVVKSILGMHCRNLV